MKPLATTLMVEMPTMAGAAELAAITTLRSTDISDAAGVKRMSEEEEEKEEKVGGKFVLPIAHKGGRRRGDEAGLWKSKME